MSQSDTSFSHDTIPYCNSFSLVDLWLLIMKQRMVVLSVTALFTGIALAYSMLLSPVYTTSVVFLPPTKADMEELAVASLQAPTPHDAYKRFAQNINSIALQRVFFSEKNLFEKLEPSGEGDKPNSKLENVVFLRFRNMLKLETKPENQDFLRASLEWPTPQEGAELLNDYVYFISKLTRSQLAQSPRKKIKKRIASLNTELKIKRNIALQRRNDRIEELKEAIHIAEQLHQDTRVPTSENEFTPLYYRGKQALAAEASLLKSRKSDDPYIADLRNLEGTIATLSKININEDNFRVAQIDQPAIPSLVKARPKRSLIVGLGMVIGLIAGLIATLFINFLTNVRKRSEELLPQ